MRPLLACRCAPLPSAPLPTHPHPTTTLLPRCPQKELVAGDTARTAPSITSLLSDWEQLATDKAVG